MKAAIIIPARYGSSRFPGKPLARLAGKSLLQHVCDAAKQVQNATTIVATDDSRIYAHAEEFGVKVIMTSPECKTGTDRVIATIKQLEHKPEYIINLQGDSPLTQPHILQNMLSMLEHKPMVTPVTRLSWDMLDKLRQAKLTTPTSGTTVIINANDEAIWFSKNIVPCIRNESELRLSETISPIYQHLGIYGYTLEMLETFASLPQGHYEKLEELEQLRVLENGYKIHVLKLDNISADNWRGVDTPEDLVFVEKIMQSTK